MVAEEGGGGDLVAPRARSSFEAEDIGSRAAALSGVAAVSLRLTSLRVDLAVGLDLMGGVSAAGGDCDVELLLIRSEVWAPPFDSLSPSAPLDGGVCCHF